MTTHTEHPTISAAKIEALADAYPPFREKIDAYYAADNRSDEDRAALFVQATDIAKAFYAGAQYRDKAFKAAIIGLIDEGALGEFTGRRVLTDYGIEGA